MFFDISNFLVRLDIFGGLEELASLYVTKPTETLHKHINEAGDRSRPAQWLLLLYRLSDVVSDNRAEVRNGAFQTLMRIFSDHGDSFSVDIWQMSLQNVLFKILRDNNILQRDMRNAIHTDDKRTLALDQTTRILLGGVAQTVAQYVESIEQTEGFLPLWQDFIALIRQFLSYKSHVVNTAALSAIVTILQSITEVRKDWASALAAVVDIWSEQIPISTTSDRRHDTEQDAFLAYALAASEIYRLTKDTITEAQIGKLAENLVLCIRQSKEVAYGGDANTPTPLQKCVLQLLQELRSDMDGVPSQLVQTAASIVELPYESRQESKVNNLPSFVAVSKDSRTWLSSLVKEHISKDELFTSGAIDQTLRVLANPITLKYEWKQNGRAPEPWKKATATSLDILPSIISQILSDKVPLDTTRSIWNRIMVIAAAIMDANLASLNIDNSWEQITKDEEYDCESLIRLRDMILPHLGNNSIPKSTREAYASSLFQASIIHAPERNELPPKDGSPLVNLGEVRFGRVHDPKPSPREDMSYLCFRELISMSAASDGSVVRIELARAAAPWLMLRFAVVLKAYIADQPLRGSMPMPRSMIEELLFVLKEMKGLECEPRALGQEDGAEDGKRMHIRLLHGLVVKAIGVAGHRRHGNGEILAALMEVLER